MYKTAVVILLALVLASSAYGMVFSWTDTAGIKHFSNKREEIPERYRAKARPLYPEQADMLPGQQNASPQPVKAEAAQANQPILPVEQSKIQQPVNVPETLKQESAPVAGRKKRHRLSQPPEQ